MGLHPRTSTLRTANQTNTHPVCPYFHRRQREAAAAGRKDAKLKYVVISEKYDKKAIKYTAPAAPFPFTSQEAYERSIRQPLGREYNPDAAFRDLTR